MDYLEIAIRIVLSMVIGGIIGIQREYNNNYAGFRTHILVSVGACIAMMTNEMLVLNYSSFSNVDVGRMGSYVISGIGFLGAGSIIKDNLRIRGLTTAAGLWVVACLGVCAGAGYYETAGMGTIVVILVLTLLKTLEEKIVRRNRSVQITIVSLNTAKRAAKVICDVGNLGIKIDEVETQDISTKKIKIIIIADISNKIKIESINQKLSAFDNFKTKSVKYVD